MHSLCTVDSCAIKLMPKIQRNLKPAIASVVHTMTASVMRRRFDVNSKGVAFAINNVMRMCVN